MSQNC